MLKLLLDLEKSFPYYRQSDCEMKQGDSFPYLGFMLVFSVLVFILEYYLDIRQLLNFKFAKRIPVELEKVIPEDKFKKSLSYGADKFSFGLFETLFMFAEGTTLTLLGWLPFAWDTASKLAVQWGLLNYTSNQLQKEILITMLFVCVLGLHDTIIGMPFSLYSTFVIEERHGFNKTTIALYFRDKAVSMALGVVIGFPVLAALITIIRWGGEYFYFYVWMFLCIFSVIMMTIYPTLIAPLFNKYTKLESGPIYTAIEALAKKVSFPLTQIFVVDGSKRSAHSNAYFYGFFKSKRIVLFDTLLKQVELPELLAILGHEIGHWRLWHTIQGFVISQLYTFALFMAFSWSQHSADLFNAFGFSYHHSDGSQAAVLVGLTLFMSTAWNPVDKVLNLLVNSNSRANEFAADKYAKDLGMGTDLASGLIKISTENLGNMVPDSWYSLYHFSHPPLVERLRAIYEDTTTTSKNKKEE